MPADSATEAPGSTSAAAARAIAAFGRVCSADLATKPGSSALRPEIDVAPPCTRSTSPRRASASMSRRTVMSETPSALDQVGHPRAAVPLDLVEDPLLALPGEHSDLLSNHGDAPGRHDAAAPSTALIVPQVEAVGGHRRRLRSVWLSTNRYDRSVAGAPHHLDARPGTATHRRRRPACVARRRSTSRATPAASSRVATYQAAPVADLVAGDRREPATGPSTYAGNGLRARQVQHARSRPWRSTPSSSVHRLAGREREELLDPDAEQVAERAGVAAEPDVVVLVDDPGEVGDDDLRAALAPRPRCSRPAASVQV